jgi:hypothetical protein
MGICTKVDAAFCPKFLLRHTDDGQKKAPRFAPWGLKPLPILAKSDKGGGDLKSRCCE